MLRYISVLGFVLIKMEVEIIAKTGKGKNSTKNDLDRTARTVFFIAHRMKGRVIYGKGLMDGTRVIFEK